MSALTELRADIAGRLEEMRETGVFKPERIMASPQGTLSLDHKSRRQLCSV